MAAAEFHGVFAHARFPPIADIAPRLHNLNMRRSLRFWIALLLPLSLAGFGVAILFHDSDALALVGLVYASTAVFLVAVALMLVAISRWRPFIGRRP